MWLGVGGGEYGTGWIPELGSLAAHPGSATYRLCDFDALLFFFFLLFLCFLICKIRIIIVSYLKGSF